jgi:heat shock protein HtpX
MARGRELFPADRGLQARMVLASILTPLLVLAAVTAIVLVAPVRIIAFIAIAVLIGVGMAIASYGKRERPAPVSAAQEPELHAAVDRICTMAGLAKPLVYVDHERQPNSWVVAPPRRPKELHVTAGLLTLLEPHELEAVVAHELAHLANHDAAVMTVVGGPGTVLLEGGRPLMRFGFWGIPGGLLAMGIGRVAQVGTTALSRYRELSADAASAALTGRPSALASALTKASGRLTVLPVADLREVAGRDAFHLLAVGDEHGLLATHPDLETRIARLEAMERRLQNARRHH